MPANPATLQLEQRHADHLKVLQERAVVQIADRWRTINPDALDLSFRRFLPAAASIIETSQTLAQHATHDFLSSLVWLESGRAWSPEAPDVTIPGTTIDGRAIQSALASVPPAVLTSIKQGRSMPFALRRGMHVAARMAATETADAARRETDHQLVAFPNLFAGWQWVARGTCAACMAMMNNATLPAGPLNAHPGCTCIKSVKLADIQESAIRTTGREKWDALSPAEQEAVFKNAGAAKARMLREGRISLNDLVTHQGSRSWRGMITEGPVPSSGRKAGQSLRDAANALLKQSKTADKRVTGTLQQLADASGGRLAGLQHRIKALDSLERKITTDLNDLAAAGTPRNAQAVADTINDALRYTMEVPAADYKAAYDLTIQTLLDEGYTLIKPTKNFWKKDGYQGAHVLAKAPDGTRFELQFHTPESLAAKDPSHKLYEEWRNVKTSDARRAELTKAIDDLWVPIHENPPPGALDI